MLSRSASLRRIGHCIHCNHSPPGCTWAPTHPLGCHGLAQLMDAWVRALAALAPQLERGVVKARIVPLALSKAQAHETSVQARTWVYIKVRERQ